MIQLEKYHGTKSRHTCPACNQRNCFVRYVKEDGGYLAETVGRCNRESKCGYHYKPKRFFADNPHLSDKIGNYKKGKKKRNPNYSFANKKDSQSEDKANNLPNKPDVIPFEYFKATLTDYDKNAFVTFLLSLFTECSDEIRNVLKMYFVGTYETYTCFPSIDRLNRICRAKLIRFDQFTGKRLKGEYDTSSLPAKLKLKKDFRYKQIFFGEHLLRSDKQKPVAVVEAEKTAIIASLCFPEFIWLGCNSKTWLKAERLRRLGNRQIILYPDADGFALWQKIALEARLQGSTVKVSSLVENHATIEQKANGYDLADYLINQQIEINRANEYIDSYNAKLDNVLSNENLFNDFQTIVEERISIFEIDGNLSRIEAEKVATMPENIRQIVTGL